MRSLMQVRALVCRGGHEPAPALEPSQTLQLSWLQFNYANSNSTEPARASGALGAVMEPMELVELHHKASAILADP